MICSTAPLTLEPVLSAALDHVTDARNPGLGGAATCPFDMMVGAEVGGLSGLVHQTRDQMASMPIANTDELLNPVVAFGRVVRRHAGTTAEDLNPPGR
jgi:hypothetical protein